MKIAKVGVLALFAAGFGAIYYAVACWSPTVAILLGGAHAVVLATALSPKPKRAGGDE